MRLPAGAGFDPGGIGKGLAADLAVAEALTEGAAGVCVNLGGDVRLEGSAPDGGAYDVLIDGKQALTFDSRASEAAEADVLLGTLDLAKGDHTIAFKAV